MGSKGKTKMRSITLIILHGFIAQVAANQDISDDDLKALQDIDMDKFVDTLKTKLVDRLMQHLGDMDSTDNVDSTTLGKAHPDAAMPKTMGTKAGPFLSNMGKQTIMGCPVEWHGPRTSGVAQASVKLGSDSGGLVFVPDSLTVKSGEAVTFTNNAGFPHNIVFDEDEVPDGVNAEALSKEDYLNAPGETYTVKFDKAGSYGYYCEPHRGAGIKGKITVQ